MSDHWFKPHAYGYGATPINWKGWAAVAAYVAVILGLSLPLLDWPPDMPAGPAAWQIATWVIMVGLLTFGFLGLCRARTDGEWRWRWGKQRQAARSGPIWATRAGDRGERSGNAPAYE